MNQIHMIKITEKDFGISIHFYLEMLTVAQVNMDFTITRPLQSSIF